MRLLMIVGNADDIFIYNLAKWLKKYIDKLSIDVIEYNDSSVDGQGFSYEYYDNVCTIPRKNILCRLPFLSRYTYWYGINKELENLLMNRKYDIIHCHYILEIYAWINIEFIKSRCKKLYFSFWGGEWENGKCMRSNRLFKKRISHKIACSDGIVNGGKGMAKKMSSYGVTPTCFYGTFGSQPLEELYTMLRFLTKNDSKEYWKFPEKKIAVQIGYSGKPQHQYLEIINVLRRQLSLKEKIHLVAPMTRGGKTEYIDSVELELHNCGYTYTLLRDRFLSNTEMAHLRNAVDVVLQLTTVDGYSRSIVECLCAGSILIYGDWLDYDVKFKKDGFEGIGVSSIHDACKILENVVSNPGKFIQMSNANQKLGRGKYLWSECIKDWVAVYKGTAKPL